MNRAVGFVGTTESGLIAGPSGEVLLFHTIDDAKEAGAINVRQVARAKTMAGGLQEYLQKIKTLPVDVRRQRMIDRLKSLETIRDRVKNQIEDALAHQRATGEYTDRQWWVSANHTLRMKGKQIKVLAEELSKVNAEIKKNNVQRHARLNDRFVHLAYKRLGKEQFEAMMEEAAAASTDPTKS
jgi:hypothetical protein